MTSLVDMSAGRLVIKDLDKQAWNVLDLREPVFFFHDSVKHVSGVMGFEAALGQKMGMCAEVSRIVL